MIIRSSKISENVYFKFKDSEQFNVPVEQFTFKFLTPRDWDNWG